MADPQNTREEADTREELRATTKRAWRKGYRQAVEGCASDSVRARVQSLYRALMTGKEPEAARADAAALVGSADDEGAGPLRAGLGKEAHTLARLALGMFALDEGRALDAIEQLDWALLTRMDGEVVRLLEAVERTLLAHAQRAPPDGDGEAEAEAEAHWHVVTPDLDAARRALGLRASDELPRLEAAALPLAEFRAAFFQTGTPALVAGVGAEWPALRKWADLRYFEHVCGHRVVPVELGRSALQAGAGWRERGLSVRALVRQHLLPSSAADHAARPLDARTIAYCAQHPLFEQVRALAADFSAPAYCAASRSGVQLVNCWLGTRETATPLHYDSYDNALVQAVGLKLVRLYAKEQTHRLYAGEPAKPPAEPSGPPAAGAAEAARVRSQGNVSPVDPDAPDLRRFPLFAQAEGRWCLLGPGDMLFIPAGCWHHVRSLSTSCSVNFWF